MLLSNIRILVTQNDAREILEHVDVLIRDNTIVEIGKDIGKKHPHEERIDCTHKLVMPGLINCHAHLGMTLLRGVSDDQELGPWLKTVIEHEHQLSDEEFSAGAHIGIAEALRTGTTTIADMYDPILPDVHAAEDLGIRMHAFPSFFAAHKALDPQGIEDSLPIDHTDTITIGLGPHSVYGTDEAFLRACSMFAKKRHMRIHMHLSETRQERAEFKAKTGMLPIEWLESIEFLGPHVMLVHAVWLTKGELDIIAKHHASIVHCPQSNMKLAGGSVMPLQEMHERKIVVGLGTDSTVSNNSLDMFREMHVCALLHKHHYWDGKAAPAQFVLDMATRDAAKTLGRNDIGSIQIGNLADIITLDLHDLNLQPIDKDRAVSHLMYAANGMNVSDVIVNGNLILKDKRFVEKE